jgi:hypothetical protein
MDQKKLSGAGIRIKAILKVGKGRGESRSLKGGKLG